MAEVQVAPVPEHSDEDISPSAPDVKAARPLTATQERKLVDYLEECFLDVTRNYKKRSDPSSTLPTLVAYLEATHHILSLVLQIPPVDPSAPLRTSLLLRLTGEVLQAITGYTPAMETLPVLLAWLNDLDRGWLAVLRAQAWDVDASEGVEAQLPEGARAAPISQTERTRLRSLLLGGTNGLEEWLERLDTAGEGFEIALERVGLEQSFNELFSGTLAEMGSLRGSEAMNDPRGMEGTC